MHSTGGFTFVEALIAVAVSTMILLFAYRIFFSQTEVVTKSLEFIHVNEGFRKVVTFMGDDIREATTILKPVPIFSSNIASQTTKPGVIMAVNTQCTKGHESCATCGKELPAKDGHASGYGLDSEGRKHCYQCCAEREKAQILKDGKGMLYLWER